MLQQDLAETLSRPSTMLFEDSSCMCRDCIWYTTRARNMSNDHSFGSTYNTRIQNAEISNRANLHHLRPSLEGQWSKTASSLRTIRVHRPNCSPVQLNTVHQIWPEMSLCSCINPHTGMWRLRASFVGPKSGWMQLTLHAQPPPTQERRRIYRT